MSHFASAPVNASGSTAEADITSSSATNANQERVPLLSDAPLRDPKLDRFGFVAFAEALAVIIDHESTATPLTIAVSAPWGGGKSSVGAMVETLLRDRVARRHGDDPRLVCWFNAWEHEDASHLGAALAGAVAREANRRRPWWRRALSPLPGAMLGASERVRRTWIIAAASVAIALIVARVGLAEQLLGIKSLPASSLGVLGATGSAMLIFQRVFATAKSAASFVDDPKSEASRGSMSDVKQQLGTLIHDATRDGRLVIVIDDLDRCDSVRALEVCRVASQLLAQEGVVTILLADMSPIAASAAARFSMAIDADPAAERADDIGRRYLEKIAQLELMLPPPDPADMRAVAIDYSKVLRQLPASPRIEMTPLERLRMALLSQCTGSRRNAPRDKRSADTLQSRWRVIRAIERAGWWPLAAGFAVSVLAASLNYYGSVYVFGIALFLTGWITAPWSMLLRLRARIRRNRLKRSVEQVKQNKDLS